VNVDAALSAELRAALSACLQRELWPPLLLRLTPDRF
jgi:hypothetical protein